MELKAIIAIALVVFIIGGLILWKHRGNMVRIAKGTESKFALHKKKESEAAEASAEDQAEPETSTQEEPAEEVSEDEEEKKLQEGEA